MSNFLVVGAGLSGATIARQLADNAHNVYVIDKRNHIGGNAHDYVNTNNERIHAYGPHLLHGDKDSVAIKWLSKFTEWTPYSHKVRALIEDGKKTTPLPVNATTLEDIFKVKLSSEDEAKSLLESLQVNIPIHNSDDVFLSSVGEKLADLFFRPYTRKMWGTSAKQIEASVGKRIPTRINRDDRYFNDSFQALPANGYTECTENILNHPRIKVKTGESFCRGMSKDYDHSFLCVPIDQYFNNCLGKLPYRSVKFENRSQKISLEATTINFTDDEKYTRMTQWDLLPNSDVARDKDHTVTYEVPCDPEENNNELYYPVRNQLSIKTYLDYKKMANELKEPITFCGRTGLFEYLDMVPAISKHLLMTQEFIKQSS